MASLVVNNITIYYSITIPITNNIKQSKNVENIAKYVKFYANYSLPSPIAFPTYEFTVVYIPLANIEKNIFIEKKAAWPAKEVLFGKLPTNIVKHSILHHFK